MPKRIQMFFKISIALVSLLFVFSCSSGDEATVERTSVTDVITGNNPVGPSGSYGSGGTSGGGACVIAVANVCYQGTVFNSQSSCETNTGGYGTFYAGQSCASSGYPNCASFGGGNYQCTP